jgi:hypothetical protein
MQAAEGQGKSYRGSRAHRLNLQGKCRPFMQLARHPFGFREIAHRNIKALASEWRTA